MDLGEIIDVTEPLEIPFMDHKITAHVYTAGWKRMTKEERDRWNSLSANGDAPSEKDGVLMARTILSILLKGWDLDGTPLEYHGKVFPENVSICPDSLLIAVSDPVLDVWNKANPTNGAQAPNGSEPTEKQETNQAESITP